jgi:hypothetical protein
MGMKESSWENLPALVLKVIAGVTENLAISPYGKHLQLTNGFHDPETAKPVGTFK